MRNLIIFVSTLLTLNSAIRAVNVSENANQQNKAKRGLLEQTHYYAEPGAIKYVQTPIYHDSAGAAASATSPNYYNYNPKPLVFNKGAESDPPKQLTVHQVLYEYQLTPHNAVSNVHVNQQFHPVPPGTVPEQRPYTPDAVQSQSAFPAHATQINPHFVNQPHILTVEPNQFSGVVTPVQHGAVINHGQGYSKLYYGPLALGHTTNAPATQNHNNGGAKYVYANGKILYHPAAVNMQFNNPYPGITVPARHHNLPGNQGYPQRPAPPVTQKPFIPSPLIGVTRYQIQQKAPIKPTEAPPVKEEVQEEEEEKSDVKEEDEESEPEDHAGYEEEEDEEPHYSGKYRYEDDDEEDHDHYREYDGDEDEDNTRSYSRHVRKKPKKSTGSKPGSRYQKNDRYKIKEGYKTNKKFSEEFKSPSEYSKYDPSSKRPKSQYNKSYKYYKSSSKSKPKKESIQGRQSQNVPIIHKEKLFHQEKWIVKKNESE